MKRKRRVSPAAVAALSAVCAALWLYQGFFRWEEDRLLAVGVGLVWLAVAAVWSARAVREKRNAGKRS